MSLDLHRRQDLRSLDLHREAVRVLNEHPERADKALQVLERWQVRGDAHCKPLWDEWKRIIEGRLWELAVEESDRGQQLRQASPLSFVLDAGVRDDIMRRWSRNAVEGRELRD